MDVKLSLSSYDSNKSLIDTVLREIPGTTVERDWLMKNHPVRGLSGPQTSFRVMN
jgi:hypothetical protein